MGLAGEWTYFTWGKAVLHALVLTLLLKSPFLPAHLNRQRVPADFAQDGLFFGCVPEQLGISFGFLNCPDFSLQGLDNLFSPCYSFTIS